jgi:SAM-dependent methyltransferase
MPEFDPSQIRGYYDRQTAGFVALGQGGGEGAIHRAVWGPGVTSRSEALHFVDDRIAALVGQVQRESGGADPPHVLDLGCGVGGSLAYLAARVPMRGTGVTISPVQARLATERIRALGLADRITCIEGDYIRLPAGLARADLAFAIESFVHGPSPTAFFTECARLVRAGGWLVICDDLRRPTADPCAARAVERFRRGWHVKTLLTRDELVRHGQQAGFTLERAEDLTSWLELGRPRDKVIAAFVTLFGWLPLSRTPIAHVVGGSALQTCLSRGWIGYDLLRFRRGAQETGGRDRAAAEDA